MNRKRILSLVLAFVMIFTLLPANAFAAEEVELTILHTNDMHGRMKASETSDDFNKVIGLGRLKTVRDEIAKDREVLVLDAGDTFHGTPFASLNKGQSVIDLLNMVPYDAMTAGNHDFNYGVDRLIELNNRAKFPIFTDNVIKEETDEKLLNPTNRIIEKNGIKIGIFGISTPETKVKSHPNNTEGYKFVDPKTTAEQEVEVLKEQGADFIIALVHLGKDGSTKEAERGTIIAEVPGVDLIIDGHSHSLIPTGEKHGETVLVQAGEYLGNIGRVDITFQDKEVQQVEASIIPFTDFFGSEQFSAIEQNPEIAEYIDKVDEENNKLMGQKIAETNLLLKGERQDVRTHQTNLGTLIGEAMIDATGADVALTNGGGIRASIPSIGQGQDITFPVEITKNHIFTTFPFENTVVMLEVSGEAIEEALNHGLSQVPSPNGGFPQVSGITYTLDGNKAKDIKINGEALDLTKNYKLATNDFLQSGGDGYEMLSGQKELASGALLSEILENYLKGKTFDEKKDLTERLSGRTRIETALEVSKEIKEAETVIIASGYNYPDALVSGSLAAKEEAPILLVGKTLDESVKDEILRLKAKKAIIVGGEVAVSEVIEKDLKEQIEVERIKGEDRYETADKIAEETYEKTDAVILVSGEDFPDALSAVNIEKHENIPILLTPKVEVRESTKKVIEKAEAEKVYVVGGEEVVSEEAVKDFTVERIKGEDRFETALATARFVREKMEGEGDDTKVELLKNHLVLANGMDYPDALVASTLVHSNDGVLLLTEENTISGTVFKYVTDHPFQGLTVVGGEAVIALPVGNAFFETLVE